MMVRTPPAKEAVGEGEPAVSPQPIAERAWLRAAR